ncbi:MAG: YoaK family protein [Devosia sp.]
MTPTPTLSLGLLLTASAGFIDAVGFIELGGYYTSFMSGNTTQLGASLAAGQIGAFLLPLSLIAMFIAGSVIGSLLALTSTRWGPSAVLSLVLMVLATALTLSLTGFSSAQSMIVLAGAAGAQNAILPAKGAARLGTTFVTGTLFAAGQDFARALRHQAPRWRWLQHLLVWASLLVGALVGAGAYAFWHLNALGIPLLVYLALLLAFSIRGPANLPT